MSKRIVYKFVAKLFKYMILFVKSDNSILHCLWINIYIKILRKNFIFCSNKPDLIELTSCEHEIKISAFTISLHS